MPGLAQDDAVVMDGEFQVAAQRSARIKNRDRSIAQNGQRGDHGLTLARVGRSDQI